MDQSRELIALKQRIEALENLLANFVEGNPIPTLIIDRHHTVTHWNQSLESISGIKAADMIGSQDQWKAFYSQKRPVMADLIVDGVSESEFWKHYRNNSEFTTLHQSPIKAGAFESQDFFPGFGESGMWLFVTACPLTNDEGQTVGAIETFQDVTALINAQKALKRNEQKYRSLFENAGDALFIMDHDRFIDCNTLSLSLFGCSSREIIDSSLFDFSPDVQPDGTDSRSLFAQRADRAYEGQAQCFYWKYHTYQNEELDEDIILSRVEIHGRFVLQAVIRDITVRRKHEKEIVRLQHYLSNIINSMPSVLIGVDKNLNVIQWNQQAQKISGLPPETVIGKNLSEVWPRLEPKRENIREAIMNRQVTKDARIFYKHKNDIRYENVTIFPLVTNHIEGAVIKVDDITYQVRMEEMMVQSEKMLSVGGLAAGMAHEINNPLAGMMQNAQVLISRLSKSMPANETAALKLGTSMDVIRQYMEQRDILTLAENINESGKRAAKIIRNILSFAKQSTSVRAKNDLSALLDKTLEIAGSDYNLTKKYDFRQIEIEKQYSPDFPMVLCDDSKVQQVFLNLLKNGAEAMQTKAGPSRFILRTYVDGPMACVDIEDNGPGMESSIRRRLFEPFFTTKGQEGGTGIGLSVSYFIIVTDHGGEISVESEPGIGTKFTVKLKY